MDKEIDLATGWDILLKKREAMGKKAAEIIESSEEGKCSYSKGYIIQEVFLCRTCTINEEGSGICVGCYLSCHLDHDIAELGPKSNFQCDCGNTRMKNKCNFTQKSESNPENLYNQNFKGKFCICGKEDSDDRECEMYMCIGCYDWFHSDCITLSNNLHNHSNIHEEIIPAIPTELLIHYFFICCKCVNKWKFIPNAYKEYLYFEGAVKRSRNQEECPLENKDDFKEYPYHVFLKKWVDERCKCNNCQNKCWPKEFLYAKDMEEKESLLGKIHEETEKIMEEEDEVQGDREENTDELYNDINRLPHESQINIAHGYQILKDAFEEMANNLQGEVCDIQAVEEFKAKLQEKYQAYKRSKFEYID